MEVKVEIKKVLVKDLKYAPYNPRKISDEMLNKLKQSIEEFGYVEPIVVNKRTRHVVGGNQRLKALEDLGIEEVEAVFVDLDDAREKALNIALNKITGEWDYPKLKDLLEELDTGEIDIELTGFDMVEIEDLMNQVHVEAEEDDFNVDEIEEIEEPITKRGDIWKLGNHRVMCGDSTIKEDVDKLMNGKKADMVFTDPPYGMSLNTDWSSAKPSSKFAKEKNVIGGKKHRPVIGDNEDFVPILITSVFDNFSYCDEIFLWGADYYSELLINKNSGSWLVWDKRIDESMDKMYGSCFELCWSKNKHKREIIRVRWAGIFGTEQEFDHKRFHPTQKPIKLCSWFINKFSNIGDIVVDLFLGSGSTLIACEQANRICYGMEIEPIYCDVIIRRWEAFTGQKAVKVNG